MTSLGLTVLTVFDFFFSIDYPPEVSGMKYCCLGVLRKEYSRRVTK